MKKIRSMLLSLTIILTVGLVFQATPVRADAGGPQNTSSSQSSGGSSPTLLDAIRLIMTIIRI
jgi:hypothetical protein